MGILCPEYDVNETKLLLGSPTFFSLEKSLRLSIFTSLPVSIFNVIPVPFKLITSFHSIVSTFGVNIDQTIRSVCSGKVLSKMSSETLCTFYFLDNI